MPKPVICMLRGVNVGGNKLVKMDVLRAICAKLGYENAQTVLQSGNVVFDAARPNAKKIEAALLETTGLEVRVFLRTPDEIRKVMDANPFPEAAKRDPGHLIVMFVEGEFADASKQALRTGYIGPESVHFGERALYIHYPEGMGRSKLTNALIERKLGMAGTARNWNTLSKLLDAAGRLAARD